MNKWQIRPQPTIPPEILDYVQDEFLAQFLVQRDLTTVEQVQAFLDPEQYQPTSAMELPGIQKAITRLKRAIAQQELICVWGDFDVDGQTSTALLVSTIQDLGGQVCYYIPNRLTESHGIKKESLQRLLTQKEIKLILTCDTGVSEHEAVQLAQAARVDTIITDHHDLPPTLPPAQAVINPKRLPLDHPLRELPGVGVAYKLAEALYQTWGRPEASEALLDLVALGIVADVAEQRNDTRYLLQKGLQILRQTNRLGLQVLIETSGLQSASLTETDIGYRLAPRMNALGRLDDANLAVELLTTEDYTQAKTLALRLEALNKRRKQFVDKVIVQARSQLEETPTLVENYHVLVLAAQEWHIGVIGIAAGRLAERYHKPVILIALQPDKQGRGSARSIAECDIHAAIQTQAHLTTKFGGHPMAAGLTLPAKNIPAFRRGVSDALAECQKGNNPTLTIDAMVRLDQVTPELRQTLQRLAPFGAGNPPIILGCEGIQIITEATFGYPGQHKRLVVEDETGYLQEVIWWQGGRERSPQGRFDLAFTLNDENNQLQLIWEKAREWDPPSPEPAIELIDWRQADAHYQNQLQNLLKEKSVLLWAEGESPPHLPSLARYQLQIAEKLIVWTAPPEASVFQQIIETVQPEQLFLIGHLSSLDSFANFITQLLGLIKYALLHKEGEIELEILSAALCHTQRTTRLGIDWLIAQGKLSLQVDEEDFLILQPGTNSPDKETITSLETQLKSALIEAAAYRRFFKEARLEALRPSVTE